MTSRTRTPLARRLCRPAWIAGLALLGAYGGGRSWYAHSYAVALETFQTAQSAVAQPSLPATQVPSDASVDMRNWSPQRAARYREALADPARPAALLRIPSVKLLVPVFEGTTDTHLNRGAGRIEGTARIGAPGNLGIAAHRDGFFRALKDVRVGDVLVIEQLRDVDEYRVVRTQIVEPSNVSVLDPTSVRSVTLVTCYPFYYVGAAPLRFIVRAELVPADRGHRVPPAAANAAD